MRRLIACLTLAAVASVGAAIAADDPEQPEVPPAEQPPTLPPTPQPTPPPTLPPTPQPTPPPTLPPTPQPTPPPTLPPTPPPAAEPVAVETDEETRALQFFLESTAWFTQPVGGDYLYATEIDPTSPFDTTTLTQAFGTSDRARWRGGVIVKDNIGAFVFTYWAATVEEPASQLHPGQFVIGETLVYPLYAGLNNDGRADGVEFQSKTGTRDTRLDFVRDAFRTQRLSARWLAGLRFVDYSQTASAAYHALLPNLPPLIDSSGDVREEFVPLADRGYRESRFSGRGIEAGLEATYRVLPKLHLEGGLVYAVLRGKSGARYVSTTHAYVGQRSEEEGPVVISPADYDCVFSNPDGALCNIFEPRIGEDPNDPLYRDYDGYSQITQRTFGVGLSDQGSSNSSSVLEVNLGFRWKAWRGLEVIGGLRQTRYDDAVLEIRPRDATLSLDGTLNFQAIEKAYRSVAYEGYYAGVAFTF